MLRTNHLPMSASSSQAELAVSLASDLHMIATTSPFAQRLTRTYFYCYSFCNYPISSLCFAITAAEGGEGDEASGMPTHDRSVK